MPRYQNETGALTFFIILACVIKAEASQRSNTRYRKQLRRPLHYWPRCATESALDFSDFADIDAMLPSAAYR